MKCGICVFSCNILDSGIIRVWWTAFFSIAFHSRFCRTFCCLFDSWRRLCDSLLITWCMSMLNWISFCLLA